MLLTLLPVRARGLARVAGLTASYLLVGDVELEGRISSDLIEPDIGGSGNWYFPESDCIVEFDC